MRKIPFLSLRSGLVALALVGQAAFAQGASSDALKTAVIFNILRYIELPEQKSSSALNLCADRNLRLARSLSSLDGRTIGSRTISVSHVAPSTDRRCDVIVLGVSSSAEIARLNRGNALLIGDDSRFAANGGAIGLFQTGAQVKFEVNLPASRNSGFRISSRVLRLAARVRQ